MQYRHMDVWKFSLLKTTILVSILYTCREQESFVLDNVFFLVDKGREDPSTTISMPLSDRQRKAI